MVTEVDGLEAGSCGEKMRKFVCSVFYFPREIEVNWEEGVRKILRRLKGVKSRFRGNWHCSRNSGTNLRFEIAD